MIYDPAAHQTLSAATHHMNVDYSAYEGMEITGRVVTTMSRGRVVVADGEYRGAPGHGKFVPRDLNQYLNLNGPGGTAHGIRRRPAAQSRRPAGSCR